MDLDQLNSASDEDMEMLMMMQMDKLSELCGVYSDMTELPSMGFNSAGGGTSSNTNVGAVQQMFNDSPPIYQDPNAPLFLINSDGGRWRGTGESPPCQNRNSMAAMREMIFRIAAMQPIHIDPKSVKPPKRRNVKISKDPQSIAARHRRERISERIRTLQRLVPGGTKMDTASMLDEAIHYVKFLKTQVQSLERAGANRGNAGIGFPVGMPNGTYLPVPHNVQ